MADQWTDFGSGFEDTGDGRQLETDLFATGGVFGDEVKADAFEAVAAAQPSNPPPPPIEQTAEPPRRGRCGQAPPTGRGCYIGRSLCCTQTPLAVGPGAVSSFGVGATSSESVRRLRV